MSNRYNMRKYKEDNMQPKSILSKSNATSTRSSRHASVSIDPAAYINYPEDQRPSFRLPQRMTSRRSTIFPTPTLCCISTPRAEDWEDSISNSSHDEKSTFASWFSRWCNPAAFLWKKEDKLKKDDQTSEVKIERM